MKELNELEFDLSTPNSIRVFVWEYKKILSF